MMLPTINEYKFCNKNTAVVEHTLTTRYTSTELLKALVFFGCAQTFISRSSAANKSSSERDTLLLLYSCNTV